LDSARAWRFPQAPHSSLDRQREQQESSRSVASPSLNHAASVGLEFGPARGAGNQLPSRLTEQRETHLRAGCRATADGADIGEKPMKLVRLAGFATLLMSPAQTQDRKDVAVTQVLSTSVTSSGQPVILPAKDAQIVVSMYDVRPGAKLSVHKHPSPRYAYVLSGNLRVSNLETGQSDTYNPGDFIVESTGQWHAGANIGGETVKLLVIDIVEKGKTNTVLHKRSFETSVITGRSSIALREEC
jgi:quercetin dioxygenase-like cupin family protein